MSEECENCVFYRCAENWREKMTKEQLRQYRTLKLELEDVNACIRQNIIQDSVQGSMKDYPYILQNKSIKGVTGENYSLLTRKAELKAQINEIESFVNGIGDYEIKKIIQMRYMTGIKQRSWQYIALKLGYCSEHTPKRKLKKYFYGGGNGGF